MTIASEAGAAAASAAETAAAIRAALPPGGLFAGHEWRISPGPLVISGKLAGELASLGRVLLQLYRAANRLYRLSAEGRQPEWVARWLDLGKPPELVALQRRAAFKNEVPRVIRPDVLLTGDGFVISELDSVPGGIGLTAWLNETCSRPGIRGENLEIIGGERGMLDGFASIFGAARRVHIVVSEESGSYRPEMEWLAARLGGRFQVQDADFSEPAPGDAVYRFFELFDLANVTGAARLFELAASRQISITPPPKPLFEEKMLFALLWNRNLADFWRRELGGGFFARLKQHVPYTWVLDPSPLPPHAAVPELNLAGWRQLAAPGRRERELILKISGFSPRAWGARGVVLGSDVSRDDWAAAVDAALADFPRSPWVLQRYHKPALREAAWFDFVGRRLARMPGRARLCPYYFVAGDGPAARPTLGGVLATICPADKKIIHGMKDSILAPCAYAPAART